MVGGAGLGVGERVHEREDPVRLEPAAGEGQEGTGSVARHVAQPEAEEQRVDLAVRLGPRVADMEVGAKSVGDEALARAFEWSGGRVVDRQLALRREERRPPTSSSGELDDLAADRQAIEPRSCTVELRVPGRVVDRPAGVAAAAQVPIVVFAGPGLVVGDHLRVDVDVRGGGAGRRAGLAEWRRRDLRLGAARGRPGRQRIAQPEPEERVVACPAEAVRAEPRPALQVIGRARRPLRPAPQAIERRRRTPDGSGHLRHSSGVQLPGGDVSMKVSGSKISASVSMPSRTRGPGREK